MWPRGLGEQSEHWILVLPTSARLLYPAYILQAQCMVPSVTVTAKMLSLP